MRTPLTLMRNASTQRMRYWQRVRRLTLLCLLAWFGLTFGVIFFARELDEWRFFDWPLSFYMAAQGLTLFYVLLIGAYAFVMRIHDQELKKGAADAE